MSDSAAKTMRTRELLAKLSPRVVSSDCLTCAAGLRFSSLCSLIVFKYDDCCHLGLHLIFKLIVLVLNSVFKFAALFLKHCIAFGCSNPSRGVCECFTACSFKKQSYFVGLHGNRTRDLSHPKRESYH